MMERAHRIGARFDCRSEPGAGTTIIVSLPLPRVPFISRLARIFRSGWEVTQMSSHADGVEGESTIRILAVDDHPVFRDGLSAMIALERDMRLVGEANTGREAVERYNALRPDITLMDLRLPDMHGVEAITQIRRSHSAARIIVLTTYLGDAQVSRALVAGARGFLMKATLRNELVDAIRSVHAGRSRIPTEVASEIAEHSQDDSLTTRELEVLRAIASGSSNKVIAARLHISEETVKTHIRSILHKLGANDRTHAVVIALRRGFLEI
jgi:DNA-binding NarL/FixJ family response regulator